MSNIERSASQSPPGCIVGEEWHGRDVVITVAGDVDMLSAPHLEARISAAMKKRPTAMIIDLSAVDFLASHGMTVLIATRSTAGPDTEVVMVADGPATSRPLKLVGVSELVPMFATLQEALTATSR